MKRITWFMGFFIAIMVFMLSTIAVQAETAKKFDLSVGGYFGIGGATDWTAWHDKSPGAFAFGIQPEVQFFPIDKLSVNFRFLWERLFYSYDDFGRSFAAPMDIFPFLFGVRYYFPIINKLKLFAGGGFGFTIMQVYYPSWYTDWYHEYRPEVRVALDFNGGVEYEIINNLALTGMFDILLPNLGPRDSGEDVIGRFMFFFGVSYYIPLKG